MKDTHNISATKLDVDVSGHWPYRKNCTTRRRVRLQFFVQIAVWFSGLQTWNSTAQDPTMFEFCALVSTEELATDFARQRGSLLSHWGRVKTEILRKMRGTSPNFPPGHLAEYWWKQMHEDRPFNHIFTEIARQFPLV